MDEGRVEGPRAATPADLPGVIALVDGAMRVGSDQTMLTDYPLVYAPANLANVQVITADDRVVATVPVLPRPYELAGCRIRIGIISPTATDPAHQHHGHGHRNLDAIVDRMTALGCELSILWTQVATFPFYEGRGWGAIAFQGVRRTCRREDADRFRHWDGEVAELDLTSSRELGEVAGLDPTTARGIGAVQALHEADVDVGVVREFADYRALLGLPNMRTLLARTDGEIVAYVVVSRAVNKPGIIEAGGDEGAIEGLVCRALLELSPGEQVDLHTQPSGMVLERVLERSLPGRPEVAQSHQMVRVNDLRGLLERLRPALERRTSGVRRRLSLEIAGTGETVSLSFDDRGVELGRDRTADHVVASATEWAALLFGSHPERPVALPEALSSLVPFELPVWTLDRS